MATKPITTVLFDLDGTLINTNELIISSFLHTLNFDEPNRYTREDVLPFMGPPLEDSFMQVAPDRVQELVDRYRAFNLEKHDELVTAFEGVEEAVQQLHQNGYKLAIVSTKIGNVVLKGLKLMNLDSYFDVVISLDEVTHAKPHPEPLLKALEQLGSTPEEAIMVGDNHHDIEGGQNAGTLTAGVSWSAKGRDYLEKFNPTVILDDMRDLIAFIETYNREKN
ncbi:pyrophosphatase PpaX [Mangrovibacillus cuniculi]|uniref:Pyrophosphatase PpaX n=1 Tax=Mangrovibacillus cuniculi TaxID=2593652 RepID=A0A7S8HGI3_9BACI|nr:pyrophosphatase PpaX [Mangrovibacillus cuniculi]QPC47465.1 pyrophosphatase PpaX [Mangrovibacillus cuniculi]